MTYKKFWFSFTYVVVSDNDVFREFGSMTIMREWFNVQLIEGELLEKGYSAIKILFFTELEI